MLYNNLKITHKTKVNPNKLPFLQAQILQKIYLDIYEQKISNLDEICTLTEYPKNSKILKLAIESLNEKGYLIGNFLDGFRVPESCTKLFNKIAEKNDYKRKEYSARLLEISKEDIPSLNLFSEKYTKSDLNKIGTVHRWYDYLEDFPNELIEEKMIEYGLNKSGLIVDPFIGSGTTSITAKFLNHTSIGFDANPLMTFISTAKTHWEIDLKSFINTVKKISKKFLDNIHKYDDLKLKKGFLDCMPKKELNQWLSPAMQKEVNLLKTYINEVKIKEIKNLLLLALIKSTLDSSYVSFCPGTTFYPFRDKEEFWNLFEKKIFQMIEDLLQVQKYELKAKSKFINDSCLNAKKYIKNNSIDFIITSPPYPNDLEYTRQTRLEMYLLDFVKSMGEVQSIKKKMVKGSTKLIFKESNAENYISHFNSIKIISDKIYEQTKDKNWGFDYPRMIREYFGDMYLCLKVFYPLLKKHSSFLLVVGDQTIKGVYIPVCDILIEMADSLGYHNCKKELFRIRRSTGHDIALPEEIVIIQK